MRLLQIFCILQLMDIITTLVAFQYGAVEMNPLVGHFLKMGPVVGLFASKMLVCGVAAMFLYRQKMRTLLIANAAYGCIILWNITTTILLSQNVA